MGVEIGSPVARAGDDRQHEGQQNGDDAHPPRDVEEEDSEVDARRAGNEHAQQEPPHRHFDIGQGILLLRLDSKDRGHFGERSRDRSPPQSESHQTGSDHHGHGRPERPAGGDGLKRRFFGREVQDALGLQDWRDNSEIDDRPDQQRHSDADAHRTGGHEDGRAFKADRVVRHQSVANVAGEERERVGKGVLAQTFSQIQVPELRSIHSQIGFQASTQTFSTAANSAGPEQTLRLHDGVAAGAVQSAERGRGGGAAGKRQLVDVD